MPLWARHCVLACAVASGLLVGTFSGPPPSANPGSRLATIEALVDHGTFAIDGTLFAGTVDKIMLDGKLYSTKPPVWSSFGALVYAALKPFGVSFAQDPALAVKLLSLALALLPHLVLLFYGNRLLGLLVRTPLWHVLGFAGLALGWLGLSYATTINNHTPATTALLAAYYHALRARGGGGRAHLAAAGLLAALAPTLDLGAVFVSAGIGLYLLAHRRRETLTVFLPAALPPLALHFALSYAISGSLLPIYLRQELYLYPGSYWLAPAGMDALDEPKVVYLFHMLLGHHGVLSMTPLVGLGLWAAGRCLRRRELVAEAALVLASFVVLVVFYTMTTHNYGGVCAGFRWLLLVTPLALVLAPRLLEELPRRLGLALFLSAFLVSSYTALDALPDPFATSAWQRLWEG